MATTFGDVPGSPPGTTFASRQALSDALVHTPTQAGIWGARDSGARSVVVSGGYEDDEDLGDVIVYTGQGGRDPISGRQVEDQEYTRGNAGLARSCAEGLPVRVTRGSGGDPAHAPKIGYRYDGLYRVDEYWQERGRSGFLVCRFRLVAMQSEPPAAVDPTPAGPAPRTEVTQQRVIRNTATVRRVKDLHRYACQACGTVMAIPGGLHYAEGAHIRPLGRPHDGPDVITNVLCLCPNDHARLDLGVIVINDDLSIVDLATGTTSGTLRTVPGHAIDKLHLAYHRSLFPVT